MEQDEKKLLKTFSLRRILIPVFIGLGAAGWLLFRDFDPDAMASVHWTWWSVLWLFIAVVLQIVRDLAYMYRIRLLTDKALSWRQSFQVIMLWEFASSVTPSIVGGSALAMFIVNREGIPLGKSTAIVMITALLDEAFYILMVPLVFIVVGTQDLFTSDDISILGMNMSSQGVFWIGYSFIVFLTTGILSGIFFSPKGFKWIIVKFFSLPILRRWKKNAEKTGDEIIITSREMKGKKLQFWLKAYGATIFSWTARYWVVNFLILAFQPVDGHFLLYAKQLVMWVIMLISPTPGSSGVAEVVFNDFLGGFIQEGLSAAFALLWRLLSYYPYLFIGAIVLPIWLRRVVKMRKNVKDKTENQEQTA